MSEQRPATEPPETPEPSGSAPEAAIDARDFAEAARRRGAESRHQAETIRKAAEMIRESGHLSERFLALRLGEGLPEVDEASRAELQGKRADLMMQLADAADLFAEYLEAAAQRGDREHRLELAAVEREIARIERRNAAKLREGIPGPGELEPLPHLPLR